jgi:hypothetical protein
MKAVPDDGRNRPKHVVHANVWFVYITQHDATI